MGVSDCFDTNYFTRDAVNGGLTVRPWMQYRLVASRTAPGRTATIPVTGAGPGVAQLLQVNVSWFNPSPIRQLVYGLVTRGGCRITLTARSRGYLLLKHGQSVGPPPTEMVEESRVGIGGSSGTSGAFAATAYAVVELRQNAITMPLRPSAPGMTILNPGLTFNARIEMFFVGEFWQSTTIAGGTSQTESSYMMGDTRIDLFAIPAP